MEILKSVSLAKKVVTDMGLYISTYRCRTFGYALPLYKNTPLNVYMNPLEADKLKGSVSLDMKYTASGQLSVKGEYNIIDEEYKIEEQQFTTLPAVLTTTIAAVTLQTGNTILGMDYINNLIRQYNNPANANEVIPANVGLEDQGLTYEKEFLNISRQQEIKAQLYTILLQKREENAITLAATANNGRIIENPLASAAPVSPKNAVIALGFIRHFA